MFGELKAEGEAEQRVNQICAIKEMGFDTPYFDKAGRKIVVDDEFALVIIPVKFS